MKRLRRERGWSEGQLARKFKVHPKKISGYGRGIHLPSTDFFILTAELFNVSLDYLAFDNREDIRQVQIGDRDLFQKLGEIDKFSEQDRAPIKVVLDTFILKNRFQKLAFTAEAGTARG
ncbi:MAG: helix-turn-helix domain-containing protein [Deltaproteobacteria bacterium]|jgi:transcriptional regulator with XRE-family HTH domain|nr:helix-turn-helix domain-containing protein [Deltaproteobacteria bacterium]